LNLLIHQGPLALFAAFVVVHALADFPLQGSYLALHKVRSQKGASGEWIVALSAHSVIHAGGVWLVSGSLGFAAAEFVVHCLIDLGKGEHKYGLIADQLLHLGCKLAYVILLVWVLPG
jgi:hypothetical protein